MNNRIRILTGILVLGEAAVLFRLAQLQIFQHTRLAKRASEQFQRVVREVPDRGVLCARGGEPLTLTLEVESCFAVPDEIEDPEWAARKLSQILGKERASEILAQLKSERPFVWIERKLEPEKALLLRRLNLPGIGFLPEKKRVTLEADFASALLGQCGMDNQGISGVEYAFDDFLRGKPMREIKGKDGRGREALEAGARLARAPERRLVLTLNRKIQHASEAALARAMEKTGSRWGCVIVQDPANGEILSMANRDGRVKKGPILKNPAVHDIFEPGSVFKVITAAGVFNENLVKEEDPFFCENGSWKYQGIPIRDHEKRGRLTFSEVMAYSSNIGMAKVALKIGKERLWRYARAFGFGNPTGVALAGEPAGILRDPQRWSEISLPMIAFGQEIGVSALQISCAMSAIANGGRLYLPLIVGRLEQDGKILQKFEPTLIRQAISPETARRLIPILEGVVDYGTGTPAKVEGYRAAGKTGTAQKYDPLTRKYSVSKHTALFSGFLPSRNPRVVITVVLDEPRITIWGGWAAGPVFKEVASACMQEMGVPPEGTIARLP